MNPELCLSSIGKKPKGINKGVGMSAITKFAGPLTIFLFGIILSFFALM